MRRIPSTQNMGFFSCFDDPCNPWISAIRALLRVLDTWTAKSQGFFSNQSGIQTRGKVRFSTDNPYHCTSSWYEDCMENELPSSEESKVDLSLTSPTSPEISGCKKFPFFLLSEWFFVAKVQRWPSLTGPWPTTRDCCICYSAASGGSCGCWDRRKRWKECCGRSFGVVLWPKCALKIWESNLGNWSSADLAQDMNVKPLAKDRWGFQEIGFRFQHAKVWWRKSNHVLREISSLAQQWVLWAPVPRVDFGWECIESGTPQQNNMKCLGNQLVDVQVRHSGWIDDRSKFFFDAFVHVAIVFCPWK